MSESLAPAGQAKECDRALPQAAVLQFPRKRLVGLDVLRCVAIVLVMFAHAPQHLRPEEFGRIIFSGMHRIGNQGVDLFFVLSGFLIGGLLFAELQRHSSLKMSRFLIRRGFKIWPLYALTVFVAFVYGLALSQQQTWSGRLRSQALLLLPNVLQIQNFVTSDKHYESLIGTTWSLAVEEHFYVMLPLLLIWLTRNGVARLRFALPAISVGLIFFCIGWRIISYDLCGGWDLRWIYTATPSRVDGLFLGVLLAYGVRFHPDFIERLRRWRVTMLVFAGLSFMPALQQKPIVPIFMSTMAFTMTAFGSACLVLNAWWYDQQNTHPSMLTRAAAKVGAWSYAIYLFHVPFAGDVIKSVHWPWRGSRVDFGVTMAVFAALSIGGGALLSIFIEQPILALRDRWFPSRNRVMLMTSAFQSSPPS